MIVSSLYYIERMTYPQIGRLAARTDLVMLPVGPPEAHGPHLPIGTDHTAARELCDRAARELEAERAECLISCAVVSDGGGRSSRGEHEAAVYEVEGCVTCS